MQDILTFMPWAAPVAGLPVAVKPAPSPAGAARMESAAVPPPVVHVAAEPVTDGDVKGRSASDGGASGAKGVVFGGESSQDGSRHGRAESVHWRRDRTLSSMKSLSRMGTVSFMHGIAVLGAVEDEDEEEVAGADGGGGGHGAPAAAAEHRRDTRKHKAPLEARRAGPRAAAVPSSPGTGKLYRRIILWLCVFSRARGSACDGGSGMPDLQEAWHAGDLFHVLREVVIGCQSLALYVPSDLHGAARRLPPHTVRGLPFSASGCTTCEAQLS